MILRRVIAHFRKQEWTAIAIDLVIVVLGVVIGIQVSNWNAARADEARAHGYLERIRDDLDADIAGYRDRIAFWSQVSAYGAKGLAYAETGNAGGATQWDLLLAYFQASQLGSFNLTTATYDELRGAGEQGLLGDPDLRWIFRHTSGRTAGQVMRRAGNGCSHAVLQSTKFVQQLLSMPSGLMRR
jgi:hypothetical protein